MISIIIKPAPKTTYAFVDSGVFGTSAVAYHEEPRFGVRFSALQERNAGFRLRFGHRRT
jgi:hypothetical protein